MKLYLFEQLFKSYKVNPDREKSKHTEIRFGSGKVEILVVKCVLYTVRLLRRTPCIKIRTGREYENGDWDSRFHESVN